MPVLERGEAGNVLVPDLVALGTQLGDGGVQVARVPQPDGVEDEPESCEPAERSDELGEPRGERVDAAHNRQ